MCKIRQAEALDSKQTSFGLPKVFQNPSRVGKEEEPWLDEICDALQHPFWLVESKMIVEKFFCCIHAASEKRSRRSLFPPLHARDIPQTKVPNFTLAIHLVLR